MEGLDIDDIGTDKRPFGPEEEESIIALCLEMPEFYISVGKYIKHTYFHKYETKIIAAMLERYFTKLGVVPTRALLKDLILKELTADDDYETVVKLLSRKPHPREVPIIKDTVVQWARHQAFGLIFSERGLNAWDNRDYDELDRMFEEAKRITDVSQRGLWFFKNPETIFVEDLEQKLTCGYRKLDAFLNNGGPTRKEVFVWMAPTGVGKSIMLVNSGVACLKLGLKVLHITLEMSEYKTALRYAGAISTIPIRDRINKKKEVKARIEKFCATYQGDLIIQEFPPDEIHVDTIYSVVDTLRRMHNWNPDVVIVDYLELMISRNQSDNKEDYTRQKRVSTQVRGMAKNLNVLCFTATQTNRGETSKTGKKESGEASLDLNRVAESYGKAMPMDYIVSVNQSPAELKSIPPRFRFYIAKNRNGEKFQTVTATVDYSTMEVKQEEIHKVI